jgi:DUF971 family protein
MPQPRSLHSHSVSRYLEIEWADGVVSRLPHRFLRLHCRCAECRQGQGAGKIIDTPEDVALLAVIPYGPASVQLEFSDGHSRGIYPFPYLRELAAAAGLSTEPNLS